MEIPLHESDESRGRLSTRAHFTALLNVKKTTKNDSQFRCQVEVSL